MIDPKHGIITDNLYQKSHDDENETDDDYMDVMDDNDNHDHDPIQGSQSSGNQEEDSPSLFCFPESLLVVQSGEQRLLQGVKVGTLDRQIERNSSYVWLAHTSIFGLCFMLVCLMK